MTISNLTQKLAEVRKFLVALAAVLAVALSEFTTDGTTRHWLAVVSSVVGAILVYWVPNATTTDSTTPLVSPDRDPGATTT